MYQQFSISLYLNHSKMFLATKAKWKNIQKDLREGEGIYVTSVFFPQIVSKHLLSLVHLYGTALSHFYSGKLKM